MAPRVIETEGVKAIEEVREKVLAEHEQDNR